MRKDCTKCGADLDGRDALASGVCDGCFNQRSMRDRQSRMYRIDEAVARGTIAPRVHCSTCGRFACEMDDFPLNDGRCDRCISALT